MGHVTILPSLAQPCSRLRPPTTRLSLLLAALAAAVVCSSLLLASPALAVIVPLEGETRVGVEPRNVTAVEYPELEPQLGETFANPQGNPVIHSSAAYVVYWDPHNAYKKMWQRLINTFMYNVGAESEHERQGEFLTNIFYVEGEYRDKTNQGVHYHITWRGAYTDTDEYPSYQAGTSCTDPNPLKYGALTCITDSQIRAELKRFIATHGHPTGMNVVYYLLTPPGVAVCLEAAGNRCSDFTRTKEEEKHHVYQSASYQESFCSYHGVINPDGAAEGDGSTVIYATVPWTAGTLGDYYASPEETGYPCQDGGFDPTSKPPEQKEHAKEESKAEQEAFEKDSPEQQREIRKRQRARRTPPRGAGAVGAK